MLSAHGGRGCISLYVNCTNRSGLFVLLGWLEMFGEIPLGCRSNPKKTNKGRESFLFSIGPLVPRPTREVCRARLSLTFLGSAKVYPAPPHPASLCLAPSSFRLACPSSGQPVPLPLPAPTPLSYPSICFFARQATSRTASQPSQFGSRPTCGRLMSWIEGMKLSQNSYQRQSHKSLWSHSFRNET